MWDASHETRKGELHASFAPHSKGDSTRVKSELRLGERAPNVHVP